jgi:hypothetical protein
MIWQSGFMGISRIMITDLALIKGFHGWGAQIYGDYADFAD